MPALTAEVVAVGDELLSGRVIDNNSNHIDQVLGRHGYRIERHQTVPDDVTTIAQVVQAAAQRAPVVLVTGGLGPTEDDLTFAALAAALGVELRFDPEVWTAIVARFAARGREPSAAQRRQALLPSGASVLENGAGIAPGIEVRLGSARVFALPGVPREMRWMLEHAVLPRLPRGTELHRRTVSAAGLGESAVEAAVAPVLAEHPDVKVGYRTRGPENDVELSSEHERSLELAAGAAAAALGAAFLPEGSVERAVVAALGQRKQTLALAESCTGGWVCKLITDVPGASAALVGGVVAYANSAKESLLGVPGPLIEAEGAVSEAVARSMAAGARDRLGATWGLSITGVAGPGGGTLHKPVGTVWVGLAGPDRSLAHRLELPGLDRDEVRSRSAKLALDRLRRALTEDTERL